LSLSGRTETLGIDCSNEVTDVIDRLEDAEDGGLLDSVLEKACLAATPGTSGVDWLAAGVLLLDDRLILGVRISVEPGTLFGLVEGKATGQKLQTARP